MVVSTKNIRKRWHALHLKHKQTVENGTTLPFPSWYMQQYLLRLNHIITHDTTECVAMELSKESSQSFSEHGQTKQQCLYLWNSFEMRFVSRIFSCIISHNEAIAAAVVVKMKMKIAITIFRYGAMKEGGREIRSETWPFSLYHPLCQKYTIVNSEWDFMYFCLMIDLITFIRPRFQFETFSLWFSDFVIWATSK